MESVNINTLKSDCMTKLTSSSDRANSGAPANIHTSWVLGGGVDDLTSPALGTVLTLWFKRKVLTKSCVGLVAAESSLSSVMMMEALMGDMGSQEGGARVQGTRPSQETRK